VAAGAAAGGCAPRQAADPADRSAAVCEPSPAATTFVLVHGAWVGGWCWGKVTDILRAEGHEVYAPSLTGLGDRSHLLSPAVSLSTHIDDVANLIAWEELANIVLVGHSYGGMVISGVAERVPAGTIRSIVYLDAMYTDDGKSIVDHFPGFVEVIGNDDPVPILPAESWGYDEALAAWADKLQTPHPRRTFYDSVRITGARDRVPTRTFVLATQNLDADGAPTFQTMAKTATAKPGWRYEELACNHDTMLFLPQETADALLRASRESPPA
jgi:pimeloyl-ACP methyl ester carboxylesterase